MFTVTHPAMRYLYTILQKVATDMFESPSRSVISYYLEVIICYLLLLTYYS
jgi:hypothetical protein